jgi:poly(3-hydroxybutyrate) depolymerase
VQREHQSGSVLPVRHRRRGIDDVRNIGRLLGHLLDAVGVDRVRAAGVR